MKTTKTIEYTKIGKNKLSYVQSMREAFFDLVKNTYLIQLMIRRDFQASYQGSLLGVFWRILFPLLPIAVYLILQIVGLLHSSSEMPRAVYLVCGLSFWQLFSSTFLAISNRLVDQAAIIKKANIALVAIYASSLGQIVFDLGIRAILLLIVLAYYNIVPGVVWLWALFLSFIICLLALAMGIFFSFFVAFSKDVKNLLQIIMQYAVFLSAVIFPIPATSFLYSVVKYNPMFYLIEAIRTAIYSNEIIFVKECMLVACFAFLLLVFVVNKIYELQRWILKGL